MVAGTEGGAVVASFDCTEKEDGGERFDCPQLFKRLEDDAESIGGLQTYALLAFRDGAKVPRDRLVLRVDGGTDGAAAATEPPSAVGLVAQAHRHNEALMQMVLRSTGVALETLAKQNSTLSKALEEANTEKVELWGMFGEVAKHQGERDEQKARLQLEDKRSDLIRDSLKLAIPGLMQKFLPSPQLQDESLARLVESLNESQVAQLFSVLTPDQQVAMGAVLDSIIRRRKTAETSSPEESKT
jgi:hypothetical protein